MKKKVSRFLVIPIALCFLSFNAACDLINSSSTYEEEVVIISEVNKAYINSSLKLIVTEISASNSESINHESEITVTSKFIIENISDHKIVLGRFAIETYVDDVSMSNTNSPSTISSGKRAEINHEVYVPKGSKSIEFLFEDPESYEHVATFIFDIPPIED